MFPVVRRVRFLLAIALKLNAVFVPFFFFFFFAYFSIVSGTNSRMQIALRQEKPPPTVHPASLVLKPCDPA